MNKDFVLIILKRFVKGFLSGGIASLTLQLATVPQFSDFESMKPWLISLVIAFLTGGILGMEKAAQGYTP